MSWLRQRPPMARCGRRPSCRLSRADGAPSRLARRSAGRTDCEGRHERAHAYASSRRIVHACFLPVVKRVTLAAGKQRKLEATLTVNRRDPAVAARLRNPLVVGGSSLLWSAAQAARFFSLLAVSADASGTTASFLPSSRAFGATGPGPATYLDVDFERFPGRIGNRLADNSPPRAMGNVWAATAAVTGMVFDAGSSALGASGTDKRLLAYVSRHGELPPSRRPAALHPHRLILETGGDSLVRVGFRQPLVTSYVAFEESIGLGTQSLASFAPRLVGGAVVSYNPWGAMTGSLRPELFVGVRASTDFSSTGTSVEPEFGTGNDWIGKSFDIFARGGLGYNLENGRWDQFFSIGTRIF